MGSMIPLTLSNRYLPGSYAPSIQISHIKPNFLGLVSIPIVENPLHAGALDGPFSLALHAHKLIVTSAVLHLQNGSEINLKVAYDRPNQLVTVSADSSFQDVHKVVIAYVGSITSIKTYKDETFGIFKTNYSDSVEGKSDNFIIATHNQPFGCRMVFPVVDELTHKVPIALTITTKSSFKAVSNARLASVETIDMCEDSRFTFQATPPMAPSVFGFVVGDLERCSLQESSPGSLQGSSPEISPGPSQEISPGPSQEPSKEAKVPVQAFVTKGDSSQVQYALRVMRDLLPLFEKTLGCPFPLEKLDLVLLPFLSDTAMENWAMITVIRDIVLLDENTAPEEKKKQVRQLIAHQMTHQWIGNLVSVDEWEYLWLIEALATFVGNYVLSLASIDASDSRDYIQSKLDCMQEMMDRDSFAPQPVDSLYESMQKIKGSLSVKSRTNDFVHRDSYEKGMILINMIAVQLQMENNDADLSSFFRALGEVISKYKFQTIKPFEMWTVMNEKCSYDLLSFVHSWVRYPGFPCVKVKSLDQKLSIEQNRFFFNDNVEELQLENQPFHVPLAMKVLSEDGHEKFVICMLTDRKLELDMQPHQLVALNFENQFYYKTVYSPEIQRTILQRASQNNIEPSSLVGLIKDYGKIMGQPIPSTDSALFGCNQLIFLLGLADSLCSDTWVVDYEVLKCLLAYVEVVKSIFLHFTEYSKFKAWIEEFGLKLMKKIGRWDSIFEVRAGNYSSVEFEVRNALLQIVSHDPEARLLCKRLFKSFVGSGRNKAFLPRELLSLMFNVTMAGASFAEYKQVLGLAKNSNVSQLKHTNATAQQVQTSAVSSLSFCQNYELLTKTLHFVNTNIDSKMIELALLGFKYEERPQAKEMLWAWYRLNYDQWVKRSLRKGSDWSKQIGVTVGNISNLVLGEVMQGRPQEVESFVESKCATLPEHKLKERMGKVEEECAEKKVIASYYADIL